MKKSIFSIFSRKRITGLYISNNTVDLVVLEHTLKGPKMVKFGQTFIYPKEDSSSSQILLESKAVDASSGQKLEPNVSKKTKEDFIVEAIQRVFKEANIKPGNVITAMPSEDSMVRYFQMPKIPRQEWTSAINFEAKRYIPFRVEDVASDFMVLQNKTSPNNMDVVFVAVRHSTVEKFIQLLEKAGVNPMVIEPASFSLMRALNAAEQINTKINTSVVHIDSSGANISILRNGVPYIIRDIPLEEVTGEGKSLEPVFEKLLAEIKISFDFYEKQFPSESIDKLIIYSTIPLENWHELVGKELQVPVEAGDPLRGIRIKKDIVPPRLAVCFGLALRGIAEQFIDVNLYKERMLVFKQKELFLKALFLEASAAVFLLIILKVLCMKGLTPLASELDKTLSERPKAEVNIKDSSIEELEAIKNEMEAKRNVLESIFSSRSYFTARLVDIARLVPDNVWLTEVDFEEKIDKKDASKVSRHLSIKGYCVIVDKASETDIVDNFLTDLKKGDGINKGMKKADIISVERTEKDGEKIARFEIMFTGQ